MNPRGPDSDAMAPTLSALLNDRRLARLFLADGKRSCALQLWVLQIRSDLGLENRLVYGRLLPYTHNSATWSASDRHAFEPVAGCSAQVIRLNLYHSSAVSASLLRLLSEGRSLEEISEALDLKLPDALRLRFPTTALVLPLAFRPVSYLLNRDAVGTRSPTSPHGMAGALSASITPLDKLSLFQIAGSAAPALAHLIIRRLNEDTGLDFGHVDSSRLGDLECLVFPSLDDSERTLLTVSRTVDPPQVRVRFLPSQVPGFSLFLSRLCITNDREVRYTSIATATPTADGAFESVFPLDAHVFATMDTAEVELFAGGPDDGAPTTLCCRWAIGYVRQINMQSHVTGVRTPPMALDWLSRTTKAAEPQRVAKALTSSHGQATIISHFGGRIADPWGQARQDLEGLLRRIHPSKSDGGFFPRWAHSNGEGRLAFVEWLRSVLARYAGQEVVIFDPYLDASGLALLLLGRNSDVHYLLFTSMPKQPAEGRLLRRKGDSAGKERLQGLDSACKNNRHLFGTGLKLRLYGMKEGWLHDRYVLIFGPDGLPVAGYNLSNSLQMLSENFPLLITPIPADAMLAMESYKSELLREAHAPPAEPEAGPPITLLFDSESNAKRPPVAYTPLAILERDYIDEVLCQWTGDASLMGMKGDTLGHRLRALDLVRDDSLVFPDLSGLQACIAKRGGQFTDFTAHWELLSELLASSAAGDCPLDPLESDPDFLAFLVQYLETAFDGRTDSYSARGATLPPESFQDSLDSLLRSGQRADTYYHPTKVRQLIWAEYFCIRILWTCAPDRLVTVVEAKVAVLSASNSGPDSLVLALLSQTISEVACSLDWGMADRQRDRLMQSSIALLQWFGWHALEAQVRVSSLLTSDLQRVSGLSDTMHLRQLGWMVQRAARDERAVDIYLTLVAALLHALPMTIPETTLVATVDSLRGHMQTLPWAEPWLFQDIVLPLLRDERAAVDDASQIWMSELLILLGPSLDGRSRLFERAREGRTTNIAAALFAESSVARQGAQLKSLQAVLKKQERVVQQPLASSSNWAQWDDALMICLWINAFVRWARFYQLAKGKDVAILDSMEEATQSIVNLRPSDEWTSRLATSHRALFDFFQEAYERTADH